MKTETRKTRDHFKKGELLFHSVHGLCLVKEIVAGQGMGEEGPCYRIEPKRTYPFQSGQSFFISLNHVADSGFHVPMKAAEAEHILDYLREGVPRPDYEILQAEAGGRHLVHMSTPLEFATAILTILARKECEYGRQDRQIFKRSAEGLTREIAFALHIPMMEAGIRIRKSLAHTAKIAPWMKSIFERLAIEESLL